MTDTDADKTAAVAAAVVPTDTDSSSKHKTDHDTDKAQDKTQVKAYDNSDQEDREKNGRHNGRSDRRNFHDRGRSGGRGGRGHGGRGFGRNFQNGNHRQNKRNNEFENLPETDDPTEIRSQVEFYFSTQNLVTDQHLFLEMEGPKNRPVPIKHLHTFKRMRRFQPFSALVAALEDSKDLIVVKDGEYAGAGNEAVKRKEPLTIPKEEGDEDKDLSVMQLFYRLKNATSNDLDKCVYVKGFGDEEDAGQIALEQFFRPFGSVMVRKRRDDNGAFKGSIFVEFDSKDSQEQFLGLDPKPKFKDSELTVMGKKEYVEMKCKEKGIKPDWELTPEERAAQHKKRREEQGDRRSNQGRDHGRYGPRGKNRGGREHHRRDDRSRSRSRSRSRTPPRRRHHDRSRSPRRHRDRSGSVDDDDWNTRRDRYRRGKDDRGSRRKDDRRDRKNEIERDAYGVPIVKDTRTEAEIAASKKRKAEEEGRSEETKKSKLEIKEDE